MPTCSWAQPQARPLQISLQQWVAVALCSSLSNSVLIIVHLMSLSYWEPPFYILCFCHPQWCEEPIFASDQLHLQAESCKQRPLSTKPLLPCYRYIIVWLFQEVCCFPDREVAGWWAWDLLRPLSRMNESSFTEGGSSECGHFSISVCFLHASL